MGTRKCLDEVRFWRFSVQKSFTKFCLDVSILLFLVSWLQPSIPLVSQLELMLFRVSSKMLTAPKNDNEMQYERLQSHIVSKFSKFIVNLFDPIGFAFQAVICIAAGDNTVQVLASSL